MHQVNHKKASNKKAVKDSVSKTQGKEKTSEKYILEGNRSIHLNMTKAPTETPVDKDAEMNTLGIQQKSDLAKKSEKTKVLNNNRENYKHAWTKENQTKEKDEKDAKMR